MHISVIHDVQYIFRDLGHSVDRASLSGHNWVIGEDEPIIKYPNRRNWRGIDQRMVDRFFRKYRHRLSEYDGFVHSFPPAFALLFEPFEKPIITISCTRFDYPTMPNQYAWMVQGLRRMSKSGQLTLIANNLLDKFYVERFTGINTLHISSLCNYMQNKKTKTIDNNFLLWTRGGQSIKSSKISTKFSIEEPYNRETIRNYAGIVHLPYNLSIMSAFEHYWQNIPMYFPDKELQTSWYQNNPNSLSEILFPGSVLFFDEELIKYADWYDPNNFSEVRLFSSKDHLESLMADDDLEEVSAKMEVSNQRRKYLIYQQWDAVLSKIN